MKGILFKPDMIKSIVAGRKTQTRRLSGLKKINQEPSEWTLANGVIASDGSNKFYHRAFAGNYDGETLWVKPRYQVGDIVYIKEAWHYLNIEENKTTPYDFGIEYADGELRWWTDNAEEMNYPLDETKRSPMFLKEKFARYFIKITDVRCERLQSITEGDAEAEGILPSQERYLRQSNVQQYSNLWDSINKKQKWESNPWVFVYFLRREEM